MDTYFCCNGLGTNPHSFQEDLTHATGEHFIPLIWQRKIQKTVFTQRITDFFDERDFQTEILDPLIEKVEKLIEEDSKMYFISYSTGSIVTEQIISSLNLKESNHLLIAPATDGSTLANALEKGIFIGKFFIPMGLVAMIQTRKMIKHKGKTWMRELLTKKTTLSKGINRTLITSVKDNIVNELKMDFSNIHTYCWEDLSHKKLGRFDKLALNQEFNEISFEKPIRRISKREILIEFLELKEGQKEGIFI
ncbi:MAG: hypothetical protein INQ03_08305 [Candidatus Heimdallarchaeota archaeon]|nr:hypothetical protein [Candidatus Heimdallarchaeota archaeon]